MLKLGYYANLQQYFNTAKIKELTETKGMQENKNKTTLTT